MIQFPGSVYRRSETRAKPKAPINTIKGDQPVFLNNMIRDAKIREKLREEDLIEKAKKEEQEVEELKKSVKFFNTISSTDDQDEDEDNNNQHNEITQKKAKITQQQQPTDSHPTLKVFGEFSMEERENRRLQRENAFSERVNIRRNDDEAITRARERYFARHPLLKKT
ncbi:MAG: hypothetical protein EZS28_004797 [Streblomastix strix]|uniref:Uncharacterized protein n=1 Tax=Streblomastix strix TaxID=222440 RepID=A0A5J4WX83_9EUKA|nr:MAG: hypothetical protein EZS28_004797 [Streblomastix strix]